jgi:hypothetical protein
VNHSIADCGLRIADYFRERAVFKEAQTMARISSASFIKESSRAAFIFPDSTSNSSQ